MIVIRKLSGETLTTLFMQNIEHTRFYEALLDTNLGKSIIPMRFINLENGTKFPIYPKGSRPTSFIDVMNSKGTYAYAKLPPSIPFIKKKITMGGRKVELDDGPVIPETYVGLKQLAFVYSKVAYAYQESNLNYPAVVYYKVAMDIDPEMDYLADLGRLLEEEGCFKLAEDYYLQAMDNWDPDNDGTRQGAIIAAFNCGDMYDTQYPVIGCPEEQRMLALKCYGFGAKLRDQPCMARYMIRCLEMCACGLSCPAEQIKYQIELHSTYATMCDMGKCCCENEEETCKCNLFDRIYNTALENTDDWVQFDDFQTSYTNLRVADDATNLYEELVKNPITNMDPLLMQKLQTAVTIMQAETDYRCYINKISLFTKLNHVTDCPICYEEKVNIDLRCGHTFCKDCYIRISDKMCPLCRIPNY